MLTYKECQEKAMELFLQVGSLRLTREEIARKLGLEDKNDIEAVEYYFDCIKRRRKQEDF